MLVGWLELGGGRLCDGWSLSLCHSFGGFDRWGTKRRVGDSKHILIFIRWFSHTLSIIERMNCSF